MLKIVTAIENNDTIKLYSLIDTAYCFYLNNKELVINKISRLNKIMAKNKISPEEDNFFYKVINQI